MKKLMLFMTLVVLNVKCAEGSKQQGPTGFAYCAAIATNDVDIVFNMVDPNSGETVLTVAAASEDSHFLKKLLTFKGVDINSVNMDLNTPLHCAVINNRLEAVKLLLGIKRVDFYLKNKAGENPIDIAL